MIFGHFYDPPRVIVQGRHGEPVKLFLYSIDSKDSYVGKCGPDKTIGLPHEQVYAYDESLFLRLIMAYEKRIWS